MPDPVSDGATPMTGLDRVAKAVADAADWPWCDEHRSPRYDGSKPCDRLHPPTPKPPGWQDPPFHNEGGTW